VDENKEEKVRYGAGADLRGGEMRAIAPTPRKEEKF